MVSDFGYRRFFLILIFVLSEFNYERNSEGKCVLSAGRTPLANDDTCRNDAEFWYERTAYRKIPFSSCEGGNRPDLGAKHQCPGIAGHSGFFWWIMVLIPISLAALVGYSYYRRGGMSRGYVVLTWSGRVHLFDSCLTFTETSVCLAMATAAAAAMATSSIRSLLYLGSSLESPGSHGRRSRRRSSRGVRVGVGARSEDGEGTGTFLLTLMRRSLGSKMRIELSIEARCFFIERRCNDVGSMGKGGCGRRSRVVVTYLLHGLICSYSTCILSEIPHQPRFVRVLKRLKIYRCGYVRCVCAMIGL